MTSRRVLMVEDSSEDAALLERELRRSGLSLEIRVVDAAAGLAKQLGERWPELVVCDFSLPDLDAPGAVARIRSTGEDLPIIVVSGSAGEERAVEIMRAGAQDFVPKDKLSRLPEVLKRELTELDLRRERTEARATLERTRVQLQRALEAARLGTWEVDLSTGGVTYSDHTAGLFALPTDGSRVHWESFLELVDDDDQAHVSEALGQVMAQAGAEMQVRFRVRHPASESWIWVEVRGRQQVGVDGRPIVAGTVADISAQRQLEERVAHSQKLDSMGRLAGGVAHDFNNLLTVILSSTAVLERELEGSPLVSDLIIPVRDAAERAANLTRQLLLFSRKQPAAPSTQSVDQLLKGFEKLLRRVLREDLVLVLDLGQVEWMVRIDAGQFEQVVMNLVVNARDASPSQGSITLTTRAFTGQPTPSHPAGEWVRLTVTDTGHGVPDALKERIFEPFFTTKDAASGTGLGLSICQAIVGQAGGVLTVEDASPGARFAVYLPRDRSVDAPASVAKVHAARKATGTILLVEDNDLVRNALKRSLLDAGFTVLVARDGIEALEQARLSAESLALVVTDVVMPRMSGPELAKKLETVAAVPVLFTSGYTADADVSEAIGAGSLLSKPFTGAQLVDKVAEMLARG
jgi:two-component system, cell cycle sensor histidine kinase and response regulator CckA